MFEWVPALRRGKAWVEALPEKPFNCQGDVVIIEDYLNAKQIESNCVLRAIIPT